MAYEQRDNSGSLFVNEDKETDSHPNAKGSAMIGGVEYWVSAWTKVTKNGDRFQSLSFKPKQQSGKPAAKTRNAPMDDDIPW